VVALTSGTGAPTTRDAMPDPPPGGFARIVANENWLNCASDGRRSTGSGGRELETFS
jgi:hypothetical protein